NVLERLAERYGPHLELRRGLPDEHNLASVHLLDRRERRHERAPPEMRRQFDGGEHVELQPNTGIRNLTANARRSGLRIEDVGDVSDLSGKLLVWIRIHGNRRVLSLLNS